MVTESDSMLNQSNHVGESRGESCSGVPEHIPAWYDVLEVRPDSTEREIYTSFNDKSYENYGRACSGIARLERFAELQAAYRQGIFELKSKGE